MPGDYDGNGSADRAVFRTSNSVWYVRGITTLQFGASGDIPIGRRTIIPGSSGGTCLSPC